MNIVIATVENEAASLIWIWRLRWNIPNPLRFVN
jgi:hypothetical protein